MFLMQCLPVIFLTLGIRLVGTLSKKRLSRTRFCQPENFHSNGIEAGWISVIWPPLVLDRIMFLKVPNTSIQSGNTGRLRLLGTWQNIIFETKSFLQVVNILTMVTSYVLYVSYYYICFCSFIIVVCGCKIIQALCDGTCNICGSTCTISISLCN